MHIWADLSKRKQVFKGWMGDVRFLTDPRSAHTTFLMPQQNVSFTATYTSAPTWNAMHEMIAGREVYYHFPQGMRGVITFYHGSGGAASEWTETSVERRLFINDAVAEGYGIIATASGDQVKRQWSLDQDPETNVDVEAMQTILDTFIARGAITDNTPVFGVGISQGSRFASLVGYELGFKAIASYCGTSEDWVMRVTTVPTIWCLAKNDAIIRDESQPTPLHQILEDRWIDTALYINPPSPLYPLRFTRIERLTPDHSREIFAELQSKGYLDEEGYLIDNPRVSRWDKNVAQNYSNEVRGFIREELFAAYAEHEFFSDCNRKVLSFFNAHLP
jgi:hypothetical protein